ncbi:cytochrome P450 2B19-like protein [Labeo rohita]|uniref:Cytochrome P450 2B19-like protein n=1 Tax=Labeo rohita TaxID=84645 RepID=A0A498LN95_LABRO|nr:cytochrome P450 2B19-like protein [Labeo rohita]
MWMSLMKLDLASVGLAVSLGFIFVVLFEIFRIKSYRGKTPPGPTPLPFVGTIPHFLLNPMEFIRSLSQYGEMATLYLGRKPAIFLNTIELVKEAMVENASSFSGRPPIPLLMWVTEGYGIVMATYGHSWKQQRRFALHSLRNFGLGKKSVEERVIEESSYLVPEMLKSEGKPFDPQHAIQNAVSNIICSIVFGDRFDYDNKRFAYLLEIVRENIIQSGIFWTERCHEEIVRVLGYDRLPSMDDRDKLPYTYATVHEIQRCGNIVPFGVFHETTQHAKLRGYDIPKGTVVYTNLTAVLTNKEHWKYPDTFNPENFLDDNGHFFKPESFLPFSLGPRICLGESLAKTELFLFITSLLQRIHFSWPPGPRVCLGESLAKMELFLFTTSLLQRIRFSWPPGAKCPDMNGIVSLVRSPEPFNIICHSRGSKE